MFVRRRKSPRVAGLDGIDAGVHRLVRSHCAGGRLRLLLTIFVLVMVIFGCTTASRHLLQAPNQTTTDEDETDKLDFSGGNNVRSAYRLGDVFAAWFLHSQTYDEFLNYYATRYPKTLAHEYLVEAGSKEYIMRNLTALLKVMGRKDKKMHYRRAREDELVVHIRLGDVLTKPRYTDLKVSMKDLWNRKEGFVNDSANIKSDYSKVEFETLVRRIPPDAAKKIKKCVIVGAGFISNEDNAHRNEEYKELVASFLRKTMNCKVSYYSSNNPDKDLMYMASGHWFIGAMGGFAQIAAACVNARKGWGHGIYDKFNGEIASWNHKLLTGSQAKIYRNEFVDWRQVKYEVPTTTSGTNKHWFGLLG